MTETVKLITLWLATATEAIAGFFIAVAVIEATLRTVPVVIYDSMARDPDRSHTAKEEVRLRLGRWLAMEFELGADILRTAIAPTWSEIGQLAAIAAVRTALNYRRLARDYERLPKPSQDCTSVFLLCYHTGPLLLQQFIIASSQTSFLLAAH